MSSRQRTRSRSCSRSTDGIVTSASSPAASNRARRIASRLSVLTLSAAGARSCSARTPRARSPPPARGAPAHSRSGPPHTPSAPGAPRRAATATARADGRPPASWSPRPWPGQRPRSSTRARARPDRPNGYRQACRYLLVLWARVEAANLRREHHPRYAGVPTTFDSEPAGPPYRLLRSRAPGPSQTQKRSQA